MNVMRSNSTRQIGAGMIEVLVAIVIVAFALLGMAGLQVSSLRYQKTAHVRGMAAQYEQDIADRIRANMAGANAGDYATAASQKFADGAGAAPALCTAAACAGAQIALADIYNWRVNLGRSMGGWGEISLTTPAPNPEYTVTVYFREPNKKDYDDTLNIPANGGTCRAGALSGAEDPNSIRCFSTTVTP